MNALSERPDRDQLEVPLRQVMSTNVLTAVPGSMVSEVTRDMRAREVGCVVVLDDESGQIAGVFTERDLLIRVVGAGLDPARTTVGVVMSTDVTTLDVQTTITDAAELVNTRGFRHVPVMAEGRLVGIISMRDLLRLRLRWMELLLDQEEQALHDAQEMLALDERWRGRALASFNERLQELGLTDQLTARVHHR